MRTTLFMIVALLGACAVEPEPSERGGAPVYDGVCREIYAVPPCQCYVDFLSDFVTRVECDAEGLAICADLDHGECVLL